MSEVNTVEYLGRLVSEVAGHIKCTNGCTVAVNIQAIIDQTDAPVLADAEPNTDDGFVPQAFNHVVTPEATPDRAVQEIPVKSTIEQVATSTRPEVGDDSGNS